MTCRPFRASRPSTGVLLSIALAMLSALGCAHTKQTIFDDGKIKVTLRSRGDETRNLDHPLIISPVRLSHILARIDIRTAAKEGQQRLPAIPLENLDAISSALARGLAEADSNQEVMVMSVRVYKRFGLFNRDHLTSFTGYQKDGVLFIHMSRSDWEVPPRREKRLPEPQVGEFPSKFRIVPGDSMEMVDQQSLAIDWRAKLFDRPTRTRITPDGKIVRRTVLMESDEDAPVEEETQRPQLLPIPEGVSPDVLRALADLEDKRRNGTVSEAQYARERLEILEAAAAP